MPSPKSLQVFMSYERLRLLAMKAMRSCLGYVVAVVYSLTIIASSVAHAQNAENVESNVVEEATAPDFQLNELRVLGNTVLSEKKIGQVLTPFLGPSKTIQDVEADRLALEDEYHGQGYGTVFVDIPEQTIGDDGVVRLKVTESRLQKTSITGTRYFSNRQIRAAIPQSNENVVPNLTQLQAQINAVNAVTSDRAVVPVLKAGTKPGTVALGLNVQDELPLHGSLEVNNQYTADTQHLRSLLGVSYDNAFGRQDSFSVNYQTSPQDTKEVGVYVASYMAHIKEGSNADRLLMNFINSSSQVATIGDINVAGKGKTYSLQWLHTLENTGSATSSFNLGIDYKNSAQSVKLSATDELNTPLSYTTLQAGYSWVKRSEARTLSVDSSIAIGVPSLGASRTEFADKCYGCKPNFSVLRSQANLVYSLPLKLTGVWSVAGQYSVEPLISNEQKLIGGVHSVRGYLEAEELGDIGINTSLELRANSRKLFKSSEFSTYLFLDAGYVSFQEPLPGQERSTGLQSIGLGLEIKAFQYLTGTLVVANPLVSANKTKRGDKRVEFVLRSTW